MNKLIMGLTAIFLIAIILITGVYVGYQYASENIEPIVITRTEYITEEVIKTQTVATIREIPVVKTIEKPHQIREFTSKEELQAWREADYEQYFTRYYYAGGGVSFEVIDCDDYARECQVRAYEAGYIVSCAKNRNRTHWYNIAVIDNFVWCFEPQSTKVWEGYPLD